MESGCHAGGPCPVAPHPDLLARQRIEYAKVKGTAEESAFKKKQHVLAQGQRTGAILGLNDGTIFPKSHFDSNVPLSAMRRAAVDRAPLSGDIQLVSLMRSYFSNLLTCLSIVLVLVEFTDVKMAPNAKERFEKLFFSKGEIPTGSVSEFYEEVSNGKVSLAGEAIGPLTLSREKAYYANGGFGYGWPEPNSMTMADEAVTLVTGKTDFNIYDNDKSGYVSIHLDVVKADTKG